MSNNDPNQPQQPGYGYPQQPGQPGGPQWGQPGPYGQQPPFGAPQPPKKRHIGRNIGIGCGSIVGLFIIIGIIAAVASSGGSSKPTAQTEPKVAPANSQSANSPSAGDGKAKAPAPTKSAAPKVVTFKVWGTAPAGALGPIDIQYGSDSDNRQGHWKDGGFTTTLPFSKKAEFYDLTAQLQGSGDIHCSVTVNGKTKTGHASG
jgi:hypothetical protein